MTQNRNLKYEMDRELENLKPVPGHDCPLFDPPAHSRRRRPVIEYEYSEGSASVAIKSESPSLFGRPNSSRRLIRRNVTIREAACDPAAATAQGGLLRLWLGILIGYEQTPNILCSSTGSIARSSLPLRSATTINGYYFRESGVNPASGQATGCTSDETTIQTINLHNRVFRKFYMIDNSWHLS